MRGFVKVARVGDIPAGEGRAFAVAGRRVAVFLKDDVYFAINDFCPHMGASLAEGYLDHDGVVCPWHAWKFCVKSGNWLDNPKSNIRTDTFEVRVVGDEIQVELTDWPTSPPALTAHEI
jgi:nitrite reductase (NADH) small subunit